MLSSDVWLIRNLGLICWVLLWEFLKCVCWHGRHIIFDAHIWVSVDTYTLLLHLLIDYLNWIVLLLRYLRFLSGWLILYGLTISITLFVIACIYSMMLANLSLDQLVFFTVLKTKVFWWLINILNLPWFRWQSYAMTSIETSIFVEILITNFDLNVFWIICILLDHLFWTNAVLGIQTLNKFIMHLLCNLILLSNVWKLVKHVWVVDISGLICWI